jgi:streptogramin lyase
MSGDSVEGKGVGAMRAVTIVSLASLALVACGCTALAGANDRADASLRVDATSTRTDGGAVDDSAIDVGALDDATSWMTESAAESGAPSPCTIPGTITEFALPGDAGKAPSGITAGPDGNLWFTWASTPAYANGTVVPGAALGRITPTGSVTEFEVPTAKSWPVSIVTGPDGNLWITEFQGEKIARVTPKGVITEFAIPTTGGQPDGITSDPYSGTLWFTDEPSNAIGRISTEGTNAVEFPIPTPNSMPTSIALGPDGNLWFVEQGGLNVGRIGTDGGIQEFPVPTPNGYENGIAAGPDGNLWFADYAHGKIGRLATDGGITELLIPIPGSKPWMVAAGPDGALWTTDGTNYIVRVTTAGVFTEFPIPTPNAGPVGITAGPDGNVWFTELAVNKVGRVCLVAGSVYDGDESGACLDAGAVVVDAGSACMTEFGGLAIGGAPEEIVQGPDGDLWFTEVGTNKVGHMTLCGTLLGEFEVPTVRSGLQGIAVGPDGNVWFTEHVANNIGRLTIAGDISEYPLANADAGPDGGVGAAPYGITSGPDGALWFAESGTDKIGRMTTSGALTEYPLSTGASPEGIVAGFDGYLWFAEYGANKIGKISTSGSLTEYAIPTYGSQPQDVALGPDGSIWFTEQLGNNIGRVAADGTVTEYAIPTPESAPQGIVAGADGNMWFVEVVGNAIGRVTPTATPMITEFVVPTPGAFPAFLAVGLDGDLWFTEFTADLVGRFTPSTACSPAPGKSGNVCSAASDSVDLNSAPWVPPSLSEASIPEWSGGPIAGATYFATSVTAYDGAAYDSGPCELPSSKSAFVLKATTPSTGTFTFLQDFEGYGTGQASGTYVATGSTFTTTQLCPPLAADAGGVTSQPYTATSGSPATFTFLNPALEGICGPSAWVWTQQ